MVLHSAALIQAAPPYGAPDAVWLFGGGNAISNAIAAQFVPAAEMNWL